MQSSMVTRPWALATGFKVDLTSYLAQTHGGMRSLAGMLGPAIFGEIPPSPQYLKVPLLVPVPVSKLKTWIVGLLLWICQVPPVTEVPMEARVPLGPVLL